MSAAPFEAVPTLRATLSDFGSELVRNNQRDLAATLRGLTSLTMRSLLRAQLDEKLLRPEEETYKAFVRRASNPDAVRSGQPDALSALFTNKGSGGSQTQMRLFIPIDKEFSTSSIEDIELIPKTPFVFVERRQKRGQRVKVVSRMLVAEECSLYPTPDPATDINAEWGVPIPNTAVHISLVADVADSLTKWQYRLQAERQLDGNVTDL